MFTVVVFFVVVMLSLFSIFIMFLVILTMFLAMLARRLFVGILSRCIKVIY